MSFSYPHPITYSNNPFVDVFNYDTNTQTNRTLSFTKNKTQLMTTKTATPTNLIVYGDQTNAVPGVSFAY